MVASRVLIAEEEAGLARLLQVLVERQGYTAELADDGAKTLELARSRKPDLIIMDPMLSLVDGPEVLRRLKHDPQTASIPIVLVTTAEDLVEFGDNGYEHVTKPFDTRSLKTAMQRALAKQMQDPVHDTPS